jgi:phage terminase small subunit
VSEAIRPEVKRLIALADELELTDFQRKFSEALAADPERNQTRAALAAGASEKSAHVEGSRTLKLDKVKRYMEALTKTATDLAERQTQRKVMGLAEALGRMTELAESDITDFITVVDNEARPDIAKAIEAGKGHLLQEFSFEDGADKDGLARTKTRFKVYDKKDALDKIIRHHGGYKDGAHEAPAQTLVNVLAILGDLPQDTLKQLRDLMTQKALPPGE